MSSSDEDVLRFVSATFPSVWTLELLLLLKSERRAWNRDQLVATLRASELVVSKALEALVAAGLASIDDTDAVYLPASRSVQECIEDVERLYHKRANAVRRAIISASTRRDSEFAAAFKVRRDRDD